MFWLIKKILSWFEPLPRKTDDRLKKKVRDHRKKVEAQSTAYTIWFSDSPGHQDGYLEGISEEKMIELSDRYGFDAEEVINHGETYMWPEGTEPYDNPRPTSDDVVGGCYRVNK